MNAIPIGARRRLALAVLLTPVFALARPAAAQQVDPGAARVQMSDVTGPNVSSLLLFETGTIKTFACPVAWGVRTTAETLAAELRAGTLEGATASGARRAPAAAAQRRLLMVLSQGDEVREASAALVAALTSDRNQDRAHKQARALVRELKGLVSNAGTMNPLDPGHRTATGMAAVVYAFNQFVEASSDAYLAEPPEEFLAIETVLSRLVVAALENEGRAVDAASRRGEFGLPCAPPPSIVAFPSPPPTRPVPPPARPVERAIEVCVLEAGRMHYVPAILLPATGDTMAVRNGARVPFASVHPDVGYAGELAWVKTGESITLGRSSFVPYGPPFVAPVTDELSVAGEFRGVPLFARKSAGAPPDVVLLPLAPRCVVQPYRLMEDIRKVR